LFDLNLGRAERARARAERADAEAEREAALGVLRVLLALEPSQPVSVEGALPARRAFAPDALVARARARADLRELEARVTQAEGELRLARAEAWPDVGLGARYEREERDDVVLGELALELPLVERGAGARAEAGARLRRLRLELAAQRRAAEAELRTALAVYDGRARAAEALEADALPLLDENERLARWSYEAGELGLTELIVIRREALATRREYLDRRLAAALAAVEVQASAGGLE
jgi:cobalt-zinc-cadmium efflux system outer membrane protein